MSDFALKIIRVERDEERTRVETRDPLLGRGVQFPSGHIVMEWRRESYPPEDRLDGPHRSTYESLDDLEQGTGGNAIVETEV